MKILVAVDGSEFSLRACRETVALARAMRKPPDVVLLNVDAPLANAVVVRIGAEDAKRYHAENAELALKPARAIFKRARLAVAAEMRIGDPGTVVAEVAESSRVDLVVMGSHGRTGLANLVMGSVATKVIARSKVPVLVVR